MVAYRNIKESILRLKRIVGNFVGELVKRLEPVPAVPVGTDAHGIIYQPCFQVETSWNACWQIMPDVRKASGASLNHSPFRADTGSTAAFPDNIFKLEYLLD
jgi:hypothetical protein